MTVKSLTPDLAREMELGEAKGVVVTEVAPGGLAYFAGIRPGDVIVAVQDHDVSDLAGFQAEFRKHDLKAGVRLQLSSDGVRRFVFLKSND